MDDLISRQDAIDAIEALKETYFDRRVILGKAQDAVNNIPSAQQWIPVTERLPEEAFGCIVTVWDTEPMTGEEFENLLPYFVGWDGEQWNDADGEQCPFEVIAWMPLPMPYRGGEEECR